MRITSLLLGGMLLVACEENEANVTPIASSTSAAALSIDAEDYFDCIGELGLTQISAHRGGPSRGYPENALETFKHTLAETGALLEVDVATSSDGVLFLHHDDNLGRTTTGRGAANEASWDELRQLSLKDPYGDVTAYGLTRLDEALEWADGKTIFQLDIKRSTDYDDLARVVKNADAEDRVILISYTENSAAALARRFPNSMISVTIESVDDVARLEERGIKKEQMLAWTGLENPNGPLAEDLQDMGIEVIFGTLGWRDSLDEQFEESGDDSGYTDISAMGIDMIATDRPVAAARNLEQSGRRARFGSCEK